MSIKEHVAAGEFRLVAANSPDLPPAPPLGAHWRGLQAVIGHGFAVIELLHDSGMRAEWFFDGDGRHYIAMADWPATTLQAMLTAFRPAVVALYETLFATADHPPPPALEHFMRIGQPLREAIIIALQPELLPEPSHHVLNAPISAPLAWAPPAALQRAASANLQDRFVAALREGNLTWPSPVDGSDMLCTAGFTLNDFNSVFRFNDRANGLDVYILASEHVSRVAGIYVPAHGVVITSGSDQSHMLLQHFPPLARNLAYHLAVYAESLLIGHAQAAPFRIATFLRPGTSAHLGHQLWNELSAIDSLIATLPAERLPIWLVAGLPGNEIEFYGPIDVLFPEIAGRVRRHFADQQAVIRHAYENRLILFRATREHITDRLQRRVWSRAAGMAQSVLPRGRILLIGLRVENRTVTNLEALCSLVIEEAIRWHPGCTIVFDGHNAHGDAANEATIRSHREHEAPQPPLMIEKAVVEAMRTRFAGQPVQLHDTLGQTLAESIVWSSACDAFVTLWGAGLAKYRWVANKPGFVITSRWNLENKGDLHLYDDPAYMVNPAPLVFVPAEAMQDAPDAPMLIPFEHQSYRNFTFDTALMRDAIRQFLMALEAAPEMLVAMAASSRPSQRQGSIDLVDTAVHGWATSSREDPVTLKIIIDDMLVGEIVCDVPRPDLLSAGIGAATPGFRFPIPPAFLDGRPHRLSVSYGDGRRLPLLNPNTDDPYIFHLRQRAA